MAPTVINGNTIDPETAAAGHFPPDAADTNYILLQTEHLLNNDETAQLIAAGAYVLCLEQDGQNARTTYRCRYVPSDLSPLKKLPFVLDAFVYHNDLVMHPMLSRYLSGPAPGQELPDSTKDAARSGEPGAIVKVMVSLHPFSKENGTWVFRQLQEKCAGDGTLGLEIIASDNNFLEAWVPESKLEQLAAIDCVDGIHPSIEPRKHVLLARPIMHFPEEGFYKSFVMYNQRYRGRGQTVAVIDTGLDLGRLVDPAIGATGFPRGYDRRTWIGTLASRVINSTDKIKLQTAVDMPPEELAWVDNDQDGHGTHVAGIVAANFTSSAPSLFRMPTVYGTAPECNLYILPFGPLLSSLAKDAYSKGARIANCSFGRQEDDRQTPYDPAGRGVDTEAIEYPDMLFIYAASNDGYVFSPQDAKDPKSPRYYKQNGAQAAAKNALVVGATWSQKRVMGDYDKAFRRDYTSFPGHQGGVIDELNPKKPKGTMFKADTLAFFSSRGPSPDNLLKPDVVAPGKGIQSMRTRSKKAKYPKKPEQDWCPDPNLAYMSGTSQATPMASGLAACIREAAVARLGVQLLARTLRAIIVNGAISLKGSIFHYIVPDSNVPNKGACWEGRLGDPPDCHQGFGRISYPHSIAHIPWYLDISSGASDQKSVAGMPSGFCETLTVKEGSTSVLTLTPGVEAHGKAFRATLAYNDQPHETLQDKLDLSLAISVMQGATLVGTKSEITQAPVNGYTKISLPSPVVLSTVRKVYCKKLPEPSTGQSLVIELKVEGAMTTPPNGGLKASYYVPFSLAWLSG